MTGFTCRGAKKGAAAGGAYSMHCSGYKGRILCFAEISAGCSSCDLSSTPSTGSAEEKGCKACFTVRMKEQSIAQQR